MNEITKNTQQNTVNLMTIPELAETTAVTVGNAYFIPADETNRDEPWKFLKIDIDGHDCIFCCKNANEPKHIKNIVPFDSFEPVGLQYLFKHSPPPNEFFLMAHAFKEYHLLTNEEKSLLNDKTN
jgi:hypothetical protein